jgi:uncharacterized membrane protein YqiK
MPTRRRRYTKEDMSQRGQALYESSIRQQVESENDGKIVAIDIEREHPRMDAEYKYSGKYSREKAEEKVENRKSERRSRE